MNKWIKLIYFLLVISVCFSFLSTIKKSKFDKYEMFYLINLARSDSEKFIDEIVTPYITKNNLGQHPNAKSLIRDLKKKKNLTPFKINEKLNYIAKNTLLIPIVLQNKPYNSFILHLYFN